VRAAVAKAESAYNVCWEVLANLKRGNEDQRLGDFQPLLATALFRLAREYQSLARKRAGLIARKASLNRNWFLARMRSTAKDQQILFQAIEIGRGLGDGLAWFFYQQDRQYLAEHAKRPPNSLPPTPLGGRGELQFIRGVRFVNGLWVLYHGITSLLRLGDVTLIDWRQLRVAALGELKSEGAGPGFIRVTVVFRGPVSRLRSGQIIRAAPSRDPVSPLGRPLADALRRQLQRIDDAVASAARPKAAFRLDASEIWDTSPLTEILQKAKRSGFTVQRARTGLLLIAYRSTSKSLYWRLKRKPTAHGLSDAGTVTKEMLVAGSRYNRLLHAVLHYSGDPQKSRLPLGAIPICWWALEPEFVRQIMLAEVLVMTVYNPAHLLVALESEGFAVEPEATHVGYAVRYPVGRGFAQVQRLDYFVDLIRYSLFTEAQVVELLKRAVESVTRRKLPHGTVAHLQFQHLLHPSFPSALKRIWNARPVQHELK
jgi:hypothetical protein